MCTRIVAHGCIDDYERTARDSCLAHTCSHLNFARSFLRWCCNIYVMHVAFNFAYTRRHNGYEEKRSMERRLLYVCEVVIIWSIAFVDHAAVC